MHANQKDQIAARLISHDPLPLGVILYITTVFDLLQPEARVLALLADGYTVPEMAGLTGYTEGAVRTYIKRAQAKTYTHTQAQLVRVVYRAGMAA